MSKNIKVEHVDGVNYIELWYGETKLGKYLSPFHYYEFESLLGKIPSIKRLMDFLGSSDFPKELLSKKMLSVKDKKTIKNLTNKHRKGYWSFVLYHLILRVRKDKHLVKMIQENELPYAATGNKTTTVELFNKDIETKSRIKSMDPYINCIKIIEELAKSNKLSDDDHIVSVIEKEAGAGFLEELKKLKIELDS